MSKIQIYLFWACRIIAALIMLQTLYFKFTGSEESVYIFTRIGMEPWGRIGIGTMELIASILLFTPGFVWLGGLLGIQLMVGALFFHLTILGIDVLGDNGYLFFLGCAVLACCSYVVWFERNHIMEIVNQLKLKIFNSK